MNPKDNMKESSVTELEISLRLVDASVAVDQTNNIVRRLALERDKLRDAIRIHRAQKADDRCIEDDDRLYEALGDGIKCDRRVGDKADMLINCARFIEKRCELGGWPTYAELESRLRTVVEKLEEAERFGLLDVAINNVPLLRQALLAAKGQS